MTRHELTSDGGFEVVVGWDRPLNTFFAQVFDVHKPEDDAEVLWIGVSLREIHDPQQVIDAVRPYAQIPADLEFRLYQEAHA
ncbi:hypothetical protein FHR83_006641 [Actinoplanes campanulatus]|uniref:Uncharacterized protein n=1 Tax=Actinoplanes campanulatus TaxID=113559 RepID=A0A7W5FHY7_9ACTN|nr:hypothetical protein [Actinoplanes campanulatus]MBB3098935.1 hypothetical protein [Actinoplanes campanulatus]GGN39789.1 hypothetical protein GCM10010109_68150 [Actinoplanes campanulatus]GID40139.1 hypothetical protein Aca09nite_66450 [Actinoplanes campanulatus]